MILNSLLWLLHISQYISSKNLVLDQDNNFYLMILGILVICLLVNVWNYYGKKLHVNLFWELIKKSALFSTQTKQRISHCLSSMLDLSNYKKGDLWLACEISEGKKMILDCKSEKDKYLGILQWEDWQYVTAGSYQPVVFQIITIDVILHYLFQNQKVDRWTRLHTIHV